MQEFKQRIAEIFQRNLNARLSPELANGMLMSIHAELETYLKKTEEKDAQPSDTDNG